MTSRQVKAARGPVDYVMAHRIAVIEGRVGFRDALALTRAYVAHGGTAFIVGRRQQMTLAGAKRLTRDGWLALETTGELPEYDVTFRVRAAPVDVPALPYRIDSTVTPAYTGEGEWWARLTESALDLLDQAWITAHRASREAAHSDSEATADETGWPALAQQMELNTGDPRPEQGTLG